MQIWMKPCRKVVPCDWCEKPITNKTYMVVGKYYQWNHWHFYKHWHPDCWIAQAVDALEKRGIVETRGRKPVPMADEAKKRRQRILGRHAFTIQRLKRATKPEEMLHLLELLSKQKKEIEEYGGAPDGWTHD